MSAQSATTTITRAVTVAEGVFAPGHLGELTQYLPFELVDDVLAQTGTVQRRSGQPYILDSCARPLTSWHCIRKRLRQHYTRTAAASTLRRTLGCLLANELGLRLQLLGSSGRRTNFGDGEQKSARQLLVASCCGQTWWSARQPVRSHTWGVGSSGMFLLFARTAIARGRPRRLDDGMFVGVVVVAYYLIGGPSEGSPRYL